MSESDPSHRREFLQGRAALKALAHLVAPGNEHPAGVEPAATPAPGDPAAQPYLVRVERAAMACVFEVFLNAGQHGEGVSAALRALDLIEELEAQLTVYRDSSELSHINRSASSEAVPVESRLFALLEQALEIHAATGGAFDITAGPLSRTWGFARRAGAIPRPDELQSALECVGSQWLELDDTAQTVRFRRTGVELNLGSIGKGYALDRCQDQMLAAGVTDFLWHGGQSSVLARGHRATGGREPATGGWTVGVRDPVGNQRNLAEIRLLDRALATSGSSVQFFRYGGKRYGHILDPRTGWPAEGVFSATVVAPTAALADALSTAFYVMGVDAAVAYCQNHAEIGVLMLYPSSQGSRVEIVTQGLEPDIWRLVDEPVPEAR